MSDAKIKVAGVILAAGTGSRMGEAKQMLPYGATTLLGQVVDAARASNLAPIIVVLGYQAKEIEAKTDLSGTQIVINPRFAEGQSSSLRAGLSAIDRDCNGAMFLLADQPLIDHQVIDTLVRAWQVSQRQILIPYCDGVRGNPVIVGAGLFKALSRIRGDQGARALFEANPDQIEKIDLRNPSVLTDVDTREAYNRLVGQ